MQLVKARMKELNSEFNEEFEVPDDENPKEYIERMLNSFNAGRDKKYIRKCVSIEEPISKETVYDWEAVIKDCGRFLYYAQRQYNNAYGNRGVKEDYKKIKGAYSKFIRGIYGNFCELVRRHGRDAYNDMTLLGNLTQERYKQLRADFKKSSLKQ